MEIRKTIQRLLPLCILVGLYACQVPKGDTQLLVIHSSEPALTTFNKIPHLAGFACIGGKRYRFTGDSLSYLPLASRSTDSCGWNGRYTFLFPGKNWETKDYDDSFWEEGEGAFGVDVPYPVHELWGVNNIYIRRHITLDLDNLKGHTVYLYYACDDQITLYLNGNPLWGRIDFVPNGCYRPLPPEALTKLQNGDNVLAACGHNISGPALLDFGLYVDNRNYTETASAILKSIEERATQTYYRYQCGDTELCLDFICPSLLKDKETATVPIALLTGLAHTSNGQPVGVQLQWYPNGHLLKPTNEATLFAYDGLDTVQYNGDNLLPAWTEGGKRKLADRLAYYETHLTELQQACDTMDSQCTGKSGLREFVSTHHFVTAQDGRLFCFNDTLGCVREAFRNFPTLVTFGRTEWMRALLDPIFEYSEDSFWTKPYPPYDLGMYPVGSRQWWLGPDYGSELAADMLTMTATVCKTEGKSDYAQEHWRILARWAEALKGAQEWRLYNGIN
jgi:hypothetical protein